MRHDSYNSLTARVARLGSTVAASALLTLAACAPVTNANLAPYAVTPHTLVAVFAHPDDESIISPVLARYAREGARV